MDTVETVLIKGGKDGPVRINKSDYDANPENYTLHTAKAANEANDTAMIDQANAAPQLAPGLELPPAPSAPTITGEPIAPSTPSPGQKLVMKDGKKYFVTDTLGARVEMTGIDKAGYASEADAWAAVGALPH